MHLGRNTERKRLHFFAFASGKNTLFIVGEIFFAVVSALSDGRRSPWGGFGSRQRLLARFFNLRMTFHGHCKKSTSKKKLLQKLPLKHLQKKLLRLKQLRQNAPLTQPL